MRGGGGGPRDGGRRMNEPPGGRGSGGRGGPGGRSPRDSRSPFSRSPVRSSTIPQPPPPPPGGRFGPPPSMGGGAPIRPFSGGGGGYSGGRGDKIPTPPPPPSTYQHRGPPPRDSGAVEAKKPSERYVVYRLMTAFLMWLIFSLGNIPTTTLQRTLTPRAAASASTASPAKRGAIVMLRAARTTAGTATKRAKTVTMIGEDPLRRRNAPRSTRSTLNIANTRRGAPMKETRMGRTVPVMRAVRRRRRRRAKRARSIASTASEAMTTRTVARRRKASLLLRTDQVRQPLPATLTLAPAPSGSTSRAKSRATRAARARKAKVGEEVEANEAVTMTAVPKKVVVVVEEVGVAEEEVVDQVTKEGDSLLSLPPFYTLFTFFSAQAIYNCGSNCPTTFPSSSTLYFNIAISNSLSLHFTHTLLSLFR